MSDQLAAYNAIGSEKAKGRIPPATALPCDECGEPACDYHHHNGYAKEHWLDVTPLCRVCHTLIERGNNQFARDIHRLLSGKPPTPKDGE